jgi:alkylation response protein AidB-like acyl-CoA dehydrogenase
MNLEEEQPLDENSVRAEARTLLEGRARLRTAEDQMDLLGAGSNDLQAGREFLKILGDWAVPTWPQAAGGKGLSPKLAAAFQEEVGRFHVPDLYPWLVGLSLVGPTVLQHGTEEQLRRWLPAIRSGEEIWCQLFSEPMAGSDLAALRCNAVRDGDNWRITGQKVWSSRAHYSQWGFLLARTDWSVPKHKGITCFAIKMDQPGVTVRPIVQMNGDSHFNEAFLDNVAVPDADRVGEPGRGWNVAMTTLGHERETIGGTASVLTVEQLLRVIQETSVPLDAVLRQRVAKTVTRIEIARMAQIRRQALASQGRAIDGDGPMAKIWLAETVKDTANLIMDIRGAAATVGEHPWLTHFLTSPSMSIRGGTDEILRNILAERVLGLPAEVRPDKEIPFASAAAAAEAVRSEAP